MTTTPRRRVLTLVVAPACVLIAVIAAVAVGAGERGHDHVAGSDSGPPRINRFEDAALPARFSAPDISWSSSGAGDVIVVRGSRCPQSHPRKIGSVSAGSWTQIDGKVTRRSHRSVICTR